jgi:hypothetical protein
VILHPGVLGLLIGSGLVVALMLAGAVIGVRVLSGWDPSSASEHQLALERMTYLVSVLVGVALWIEIGSALLFIHTVDDLHELFVGAMCATGSLNANPIGWWVLATKAAMVLLFPVWIALNRLDQRAGDYPVVRLKYALLLALTPIALADFVLQIRYFRGIEPDIITSCCGSLFSESSDKVTGDIASLPAAGTLPVFAAVSVIFLLALAWARVGTGPASKIVVATLSPLILALGVVAIISFVSVAYYELPTHHCPFDLFQGGNGYVGYPLMTSLVVAVVAAFLPGIFLPVARRTSLGGLITNSEKKWLTLSIAAYSLFVVFAAWPLVFGNLAWELM